MPNLASAKKRVKQNERNRIRNRARKSVIKTETRRLLDVLGTGDVKAATDAFTLVTIEELDYLREAAHMRLYRILLSGCNDIAVPEPLANLNHPQAPRGDMSPCLSADGKRLYFASDRPGGQGGLDIWYVLTAQLK